ncbi:MAG TPA: T9SS type A sorting domain-containing protein, partial [Flavisolibacter sp.]|nr:T9SS type A sorting domain-containing protein [Flavisolibacter sp.]
TPWRGFTGAQYVGSGACTPPSFLTDRTIVLDASCGRNDGNISLIPTAGTGPFQYSIDGGTTYIEGANSGYTFQNLPPGTYNLRLKDANGCESNSVQKTIRSVYGGPTFLNNNSIVLDASCAGNDGQISLIPTSGTAPFLYSIDDGATYVSGPASGYTFMGLKAGSYQLRLKDSRGCESQTVVRDVRPNAFGPCATAMVIRPWLRSTGTMDNDAVDVKAYPNPSKGRFQVQLKNLAAPRVQLSILDDRGTVVQNELVNTLKENTVAIDLSGSPKGVYLVRVVSDKGVQLAKVVIQ